MIHDNEVSRLLRFNLYYLGIQILLAVSSIFTQKFDRITTIALSLVISVFTFFPLWIFYKLFKNKNTIIKYGAIVVASLLSLFCFFILLTSAAIMGVEDSNEWTLQYLTSFLLDTLAIQFLKNIVIIYIIKYYFLNGKLLFLKFFIGNVAIENFY